MTSKFDVERAVKASDLPSSERLLMFVLLTHADNDSAVIPAKFTPSLSGLASESGMDRSTVQRNLRRLEAKDWVTRRPPPVEQSRKGVRTQYRLAVPVGAHDTYPVGAPGTQVGAQDTQGGCTCHTPVGAQDTMPRCVVHPMSTQSLDATHSTPRVGARSDASRNGKPRPSDEFDACVSTVLDTLNAEFGKEYDRRDVSDMVSGFLSGRAVSDPLAYVRAAVKKNPRQFRPQGAHPRYQPEKAR